MAQSPGIRRGTAAPVQRQDDYVFDMKNALRVWANEAVKRGELAEHDAAEMVRHIDPSRAADVGEDYTKLLGGALKDTAGNVVLAKKLTKDFQRWWGVRVYFKPGVKGDLVIIKGWPNGRQLLSATRYRVSNPKIMELQIGKPGIQAAAKESARFGIVLVVAVDLIQFVRDHNLAHLLGSLTVDIPSVMLASAIGAAAGTLAAGTLVIGTIALGPALVAFGVGVAVGVGLFALDKHFGITEKVTAAYERGLKKLESWWDAIGSDAERRWNDFVNSGFIRDMTAEFTGFGRPLPNRGALF